MVYSGSRSTIQNTVLKQLNCAALVSSDILVISPDGAGLGEAPVLLLGDHLPQTRLVLEQRADVDHERVPHPAPEVGEGPVELDWRDVARGHLHQHPRDDGHALTIHLPVWCKHNVIFSICYNMISLLGVGRPQAAGEDIEVDGQVVEVLQEPLGQLVASLGLVSVAAH